MTGFISQEQPAGEIHLTDDEDENLDLTNVDLELPFSETDSNYLKQFTTWKLLFI